jgi:hypothetical protein
MRKILPILLVSVLMISLAGCATNGYYDPARSTAAGGLGGAAVGAALGSIIGAATGSPATGAWIGAASGAVVGAVGGYLYARHRNSQIHDARMAAAAHRYEAMQGNFVAIDRVSTSPTTIRPGGQVDMETTYTVLTPDNQPAPVDIVREIQYQGRQVINPNQNRVVKPNGTYVDQVAFTVPQDANPGTYTLLTQVLAGGASDTRTSYFNVVR